MGGNWHGEKKEKLHRKKTIEKGAPTRPLEMELMVKIWGLHKVGTQVETLLDFFLSGSKK